MKGATAQKLSDASIDFTTDTKYGDYELDVNGLPKTVNTVYGVVISTKKETTTDFVILKISGKRKNWHGVPDL